MWQSRDGALVRPVRWLLVVLAVSSVACTQRIALSSPQPTAEWLAYAALRRMPTDSICALSCSIVLVDPEIADSRRRDRIVGRLELRTVLDTHARHVLRAAPIQALRGDTIVYQVHVLRMSNNEAGVHVGIYRAYLGSDGQWQAYLVGDAMMLFSGSGDQWALTRLSIAEI